MVHDDENAIVREANCPYRAGRWREASQLYRQLAEAGRVDCQLFLGELLSTGGHGIERDRRQADIWLTTAAKAGHPRAFYLLGVSSYMQGDYSGSIDNFVRAGELGFASGYYRAGTMYHKGFGVDKDIEKALHYYFLAGSMGQISAKKYRALLLMRGHKGAFCRPVGFFLYISLFLHAFLQAYRDPSSEKLYKQEAFSRYPRLRIPAISALRDQTSLDPRVAGTFLKSSSNAASRLPREALRQDIEAH